MCPTTLELGRHHGGGVRAVAAAPDGRVVSAASDGRVVICDSRPLGATAEMSFYAVAVGIRPDPGRVGLLNLVLVQEDQTVST